MEIIIHPNQGIEISGKGHISFGMTREQVQSFFTERGKEVKKKDDTEIIIDCYYQSSICFFYNKNILRGVTIESTLTEYEYEVIFEGQALLNQRSEEIEKLLIQADENLLIDGYFSSKKLGLYITYMLYSGDEKSDFVDYILISTSEHLEEMQNISYDFVAPSGVLPLYFKVERELLNDEIIITCAKIFSLSPKEIIITEDSLQPIDKNIQLVCEKEFINGDFRMSLSFNAENDLVNEQAEAIGDQLAIVQKFCEIWHSKCLIGVAFDSAEDYEEDAYFLVQEKMPPELVYIDIDKWADDGYIHILSR